MKTYLGQFGSIFLFLAISIFSSCTKEDILDEDSSLESIELETNSSDNSNRQSMYSSGAQDGGN